MNRAGGSTWLAILAAAVVGSTASPAIADPNLNLDQADHVELRLRHIDEKRSEGLALGIWGAANLVGGGAVAAALHGEGFWLGAGLTSAGFGLVNALLSLGMLDLGGSRRGAVETGPAPDPIPSAAAEYRSGQIFALNLGLDVAYIASGILMAVIGEGHTGQGALTGSGIAMAGQGVFLLAFDIIAWIRSNGRAADWERLALPRSAP